jgi:hypothetical protein
LNKTLVIATLFIILLSSTLCRNVFANAPPQLVSKFSTTFPIIDGHLEAGWNDTKKYEVNLTGPPDIEAWLYIKHNETHIHIGIILWSFAVHALDEFVLAFDEGDDGNHGSGTRDHVLTLLQEDLKVCRDDHTLSDGYYNGTFYAKDDEIDFAADCAHENDHDTDASEIEYWEGLGWVDDHWECEFAIPFVGNDSGVSDVSDLSCNVTDTIGVKIQYYFPFNSSYYPSGNLYQIDAYADLSFPAPTIESCNMTGEKKDTFNLHEDVYANGSGFLPSQTYDFYIVNDTDWTNSMTIPERVPSTATSVTSDSNGNLSSTLVWSDPSTLGAYDIIVDVNGNGHYDEGIDALDNNDIQVTAGFVVPEFLPLFALLLFTIAALATVIARKKLLT